MKRFVRAAAFAARAHAGQRRRTGSGPGEPFVNHPLAVAALLVEAGVTDEATLVAAVLHDTLEDTGTTRETLASEFGEEVAAVVEELTVPRGLTRAEKKAWQVRKAPGMSRAAKLVKYADQAHNVHETWTLRPWGPERARQYVERCARVVEALGFPTDLARAGPVPEGYLAEWFAREVRLARNAFDAS